MKALRIYAGPKARRHIEQHGLLPQHVSVIPGAAGGPKGLVLGPLDRFIFGEWLPQSSQPVHLVGASIGAWRMATACLNEPVRAFERLECGAVVHDDAPTFRADAMPYGGVRGSGTGREGPASAYLEMTEPRLLLLRTIANS